MFLGDRLIRGQGSIMKFFVPFDDELLVRFPELVGELVPFLLDYPCYRPLEERDSTELFTCEIIEVAEEPPESESAEP